MRPRRILKPRATTPKSRRQYVSQSQALALARTATAAKQDKMPRYVKPLLATLVDTPPTGARCLHEIKYVGYRLQLHVSDAGVRCYTRRGYDWSARFPTLVQAAGGL